MRYASQRPRFYQKMIELLPQRGLEDRAAAQVRKRLQSNGLAACGSGHPSWLACGIAIAVQRGENLQPYVKRKAPAHVVLGVAQKVLCHRENAGILLGIAADQIKTLVRAFLPNFVLGRVHLRSRIVKDEDFLIGFALPCHFFSARLAKTNAVSRAAAGEQDSAAGVAQVVQVASNLAPSEHAIHREAQGRSGKWKARGSSASQAQSAHASAARAGTDFELLPVLRRL